MMKKWKLGLFLPFGPNYRSFRKIQSNPASHTAWRTLKRSSMQNLNKIHQTVFEKVMEKWKLGPFWPFGPNFRAFRKIQSNPASHTAWRTIVSSSMQNLNKIHQTVFEKMTEKWKLGLFRPFGPNFWAFKKIQSNPASHTAWRTLICSLLQIFGKIHRTVFKKLTFEVHFLENRASIFEILVSIKLVGHSARSVKILGP